MKYRITKLVLVGATMLSTCSSASHAGPILDWLFPNRAARRAASNVGQVTYRIPVNAYQYTSSGYSPTTSYRTVWAPIPVTQYRPVSYVNPLSTGTQTNMLPCSTQQWQARRVPYTAYQPSSLFGGGSGWQSAGQTYPSVTAGYGGAPVNHRQATTWTPITPSGVTSYYRSASPISDGWTVVGSGVTSAVPSDGGTGLLSYGSAPARVGAGYPDAATFSPSGVTPLPSSMEQSPWKPLSNSESGDVCQNCPASSGEQRTPWTPIDSDDASDQKDDGSRTRVTPADQSPTLAEDPDSGRYESSYGSDPYRWKPVREKDDNELKPVRPQVERSTRYRPRGTYGVNRDQVRPALSRDDDPYLSREPSRAAYQRDTDTRSAPAQTVPYLKPIPDLNRERRQQPIPSLREETDERTAQHARSRPARQMVPIDWNPVDIDRQGGLTRSKVPSQPSLREQTPLIELGPSQVDDDEGGWRRVR